MRVVREELPQEGFETIYGRMKTGKRYALKLEGDEILVYLGEDCELTKEEMLELERVTSILEGI